MIDQILPLLLMESTPQGITQENTMIAVFTRHPNLNHWKLAEGQTQEKMDDIIIHQTVIILPISKKHIQDRRNHDLMRHSSKEPGGYPHRNHSPTFEVAEHRQFTLHNFIPSPLQLLIPKARTEHRSIHTPPYFCKTDRRSKSLKEAAGIKPFLYFLTIYSGSSIHCR